MRESDSESWFMCVHVNMMPMIQGAVLDLNHPFTDLLLALFGCVRPVRNRWFACVRLCARDDDVDVVSRRCPLPGAHSTGG